MIRDTRIRLYMLASCSALPIMLSACTVEGSKQARATDSIAAAAAGAVVAPPAATPVATPAAVAPSTTRSVKDSPVKSSPRPPTKIKNEPTVGGERDSAVQPIMGIGADGKLHPIKK